MAVTLVGIVYSIALSHCRRIIVPSDNDSELDVYFDIKDGEAIMLLPYESAMAMDESAINEEIALKTGNPVKSDHCIAVDSTGLITHVICADPSIDHIDGRTLYLLNDCEVGGTYIDGVYSPPPDTVA